MSSSSWVHMVPHAKNVVVFRNGDPFHMGRRMVVNEKQFLTFEAFLNEVTGCIQAPVAVRSIYTPRNGHKVTDLGDLQNKGQYVAGGAEKFRRLDYLHTEIKPTAAPRIHRDTQQVSPKPNFLARWRKDTQLPCIIHVFRNGDLMTPPFRVLLPPSILKEWELVLTLLTQKVNLYSGAVRRLCTLDGVYLSNGSELVSGEYYVAVGSEKYKCLPYQELLIQHGDKTRTSAKRRIIKAGVGKVYSVSQDGVSDSALIDSSPQGDDRRVHSTGTAVKTSGPKHMAKKEESIFYAKPVRVHPNRKPKPNQEESNRGGVFKVKETRHELEGAQEVREDEQTHVELPVDQRVAEVVQEENIAKDTKIQRKEVSFWNIRRTFMAIRRVRTEYCQAQHSVDADK
ncbi:doublecortin domain-containing protein 2B [Rhinophrynus dorsalis]